MQLLRVSDCNLYIYIKCFEDGLYNQLNAYKLISTNRLQKGWLPGTFKSVLLFLTIAITVLSSLPCIRQYFSILPPSLKFI
jgi:hypothetical protein